MDHGAAITQQADRFDQVLMAFSFVQISHAKQQRRSGQGGGKLDPLRHLHARVQHDDIAAERAAAEGAGRGHAVLGNEAEEGRPADFHGQQIIVGDIAAVGGATPGDPAHVAGHHGHRAGYGRPLGMDVVGAPLPRQPGDPQALGVRQEILQPGRQVTTAEKPAQRRLARGSGGEGTPPGPPPGFRRRAAAETGPVPASPSASRLFTSAEGERGTISSWQPCRTIS